MSPISAQVSAAKRRLAEGLGRLKELHEGGGLGRDVSRAATDLRDEVLLDLYQAAAVHYEAEHDRPLSEEITLVAHGGYGRRDIAPFSDVDLMILCPAAVRRQVVPSIEQLFRDVIDSGMVLGHSVRTVEEACSLSRQDAVIGTSLIESRFLIGNQRLYSQFQRRFRRLLRGRTSTLIGAIDRARFEERMKFGETVYLLEPNLKRSRGGLRDLQLIRWIGMVSHGSADPDDLMAAAALSIEDHRVVSNAVEFLLRLRNELHFHAGRANDVLDRAEQLRIAEKRGYQVATGMLPVERFMRDYFRYTDEVSHTAGRFLDKARFPNRIGKALTTLFGHRIEGGFSVGPMHIVANARGRRRLRRDVSAVMQLIDLANLYDKQIHPETWEVVRQASADWPAEIDAPLYARFRSLLSHPARLGELLRALHEVALLERFIPAFAHARGLLQFNQYHKYTVDEHCFLAVDRATEMMFDEGPLGDVYRAIERKDLLHLSLLLHDLGKGFPENHREVGTRIAEETAERFQLTDEETDIVKFLVYNHEMMNHLAFRRDTSDEKLIVQFAVDVGSPELLRMLYLVTACDLGAVGPGVWDSWKAEVVTDLYRRAMRHLAGQSFTVTREEELRERRDAVRACLDAEKEDAWYIRQIEALPAGYLDLSTAQQIADDLKMLAGRVASDVSTQARFSPRTRTVQVTVGTSERITPGLFHKLTGALSSKGLQILSAEINTLAEGLVLDRFEVIDPDFSGQPAPERIREIDVALVASLRESAASDPKFRRTWQVNQGYRPGVQVARTRVRIDNHTSEDYTILDIFAGDRIGLLYQITRTLFELDLSVWRAKITTFRDQALDVFYVTDQQGDRIEDEFRLQEIRLRLLDVILTETKQ